MTDQIEELIESLKSRAGPELQSELDAVNRRVQELQTEYHQREERVRDLQTENEQLRETTASLKSELEKTTKGTLQLASELEQRHQQLFESAVEGIYTTTDGLEEYVMANPAFADLLGYESGEELCKTVDSIEADVFVDADTYAEYAETLQSAGEIAQFEYQVRTAAGEIRWVSDSISNFTDENGEIEGYRGGVIDITEEKKQERDLQQQTNLSIVLNRVLRHNLRNDLTVIRGLTQMMAENMDEDAHGQTALDAIDELIELSEKARELDEIVAKDSKAEPTDILSIIDGVIRQLQEEYPSALISVQTKQKEITANVFPSFERAIRELIDNAVKHSGDKPRVEVTVETSPNEVQIQIADNGPGIGEQEASVLKSGAETSLLHGSGLGLWLTHWILTNHQGNIDATVSDAGTTLTVSVPRTEPEEDPKQLTEILRARDQYKAGFEESGDGMIIVDEAARMLDVNEEAAIIFGVDKSELLGRSIPDFLPEEFDFESEWAEMQASGMKRGEVTVISKDGLNTPIEYTAKSDIVPGQHLIVFKDITERKDRDQQVIEMKERYQTLVEAAPDSVLVADAETGEIIEVSEAAETLFGMPGDEIIGQNQSDLHPPDKAEFYRELFEEHAKHGGTKRRLPDGSPIYIMRADGEHIPVEISVSTVSLPDGPVTYGIFRDIQDQIERRQQLEETTKRLNVALEGTNTGVWEWNLETDAVIWSESMELLFGLERDSFEGTFEAFSKRVHPDDRQDLQDAIEGALETDGMFQSEYRILREDGEDLWGLARGEVVESGDGSKRMVGIVTDVTERKKWEEELELADTVFQETQDALFLIEVTDNEEFYIQRVNDRYEELTGLTGVNIRGKTPRELVGDTIGAEIEERYKRCIEQRETIHYVEEIPIEGEPKQWETKLTPVIRDGQIRHLIGAMRDITGQEKRN